MGGEPHGHRLPTHESGHLPNFLWGLLTAVGQRREMKPKFLTPAEAAEAAGVSVSLLYQLCDERRLAHYRVGGKGKRGKILIDPRDLERFLDEHRVDAR